MKPRRHFEPAGTPCRKVARRRLPAFTLVEVMVALAIFTGVVAAIYACWTSVLRSSQVGLAAAAEAQRKRMAIRCLEDAFLSAQMFNQNAHYYSFFADTAREEGASLSLVAHLPRSFPRSGSFEGLPLRRVTFTLEPDAGGGKALLMEQVPVLFEPDIEETNNRLVLARDVRLFIVEFWGPNSREWEPEWLATNQLPRLVRFSLGFGGPGLKVQEEDVATRVIALPTMGVPATIAAAGPRGNLPGGIPGQGPGMGPMPGGDRGRAPPPGSGPRFNPPRGRGP